MEHNYNDEISGVIPEDMAYERYQVSDDPADAHNDDSYIAEEFEQYARDQLSDMTADKPCYESDGVRSTSIQSANRLNLRENGAMYDDSFYLEEGQLLPTYEIESDMKSYNMSFSREDFLRNVVPRAANHYFDDDGLQAVTERPFAPAEYAQRIRADQRNFQKRWQNYEESLDNMLTPAGPEYGRVNALMVEKSGTILNLSDAPAVLRRDPVNNYSNATKMFHHGSVTDHRIRIASYNQIAPIVHPCAVNPRKSLNNIEYDHARVKQIEDNKMSRKLAKNIIDVVQNRVNTKESFAETKYGKTRELRSRKFGASAKLDRIFEMATNSAKLSDSNDKLDGRKVMSVEQTKSNALLRKSLISPNVAESMAAATKATIEKKSDIREQVLSSALFSEALTDSIKAGTKKDGMLNRDTSHSQMFGDAKTVASYAAFKPQKNSATRARSNFEELRNDSWQTKATGGVQKIGQKPRNTMAIDIENAESVSAAPVSVHMARQKPRYNEFETINDIRRKDEKVSLVKNPIIQIPLL